MPARNVAEGGRGSMRGRGRSISFSIPAAAAAAGSFFMLPPPVIHTPGGALNDALRFWPPPQSRRDRIVESIVLVVVGPSGYTKRFGAVPDLGLARRAVAAIEEEGFARTCVSAARTSFDSVANQLGIARLYARTIFTRLDKFGATYATDPDAAFAALGLGAAWREWKKSSSATAAPASQAGGASSSSPSPATAPPPAAAAP